MMTCVDARIREFQVHLLPWMSHPPKTYADGVMLVGDAGGFPCPLEGERVWHALMTGRIAAQVAAKAVSRSDPSEKTLREYEQRWKEPPLGKEYEFGQEYVKFWRHSVFNPELMKKIVQFMGEFQYVNFPGPAFDWSDDHMGAFNQHLGHLLDVMPELSDFAKECLLPLGRGVSMENRDRIAHMLAGVIKAKLPRFIPMWPIRALLRKGLGIS